MLQNGSEGLGDMVAVQFFDPFGLRNCHGGGMVWVNSAFPRNDFPFKNDFPGMLGDTKFAEFVGHSRMIGMPHPAAEVD